MRAPAAVTCLLALGTLLGCASASFDEGQQALSAGSWQRAIAALDRFLGDADCADPTMAGRCKEARIDIAECHLRLADPKKAYFALESARPLEPHGPPLDERLDRLEREAQDAYATGVARPPGDGTLSVRFTSQVHDRIRFHHARFFLDLHPLPTDDVPYVAGTTVLPVPPTSVSLGPHELEILTVYKGHGIGPYRYLNGYTFSAQAAQSLVVGPAAPTEVEVRVYDGAEGPIADSIHINLVIRAAAAPGAAPP